MRLSSLERKSLGVMPKDFLGDDQRKVKDEKKDEPIKSTSSSSCFGFLYLEHVLFAIHEPDCANFDLKWSPLPQHLSLTVLAETAGGVYESRASRKEILPRRPYTHVETWFIISS